MKIKERIKNVGFWVSLLGSVFLMLGAFGIEIGDETAGAIINAVSSMLVLFGIASDPTSGAGYLDAADSVPDADGVTATVAAAETADGDKSGEDNGGATGIEKRREKT